MDKTILREIQKYLSVAKKGKQSYRESVQVALIIFLANYNDKLAKNTQPLVNILEATGNDSKFVREYCRKAISNLEFATKTPKGGLKLVLKDGANEIIIDEKYVDSVQWYNSIEKLDKKAVNEFTDFNSLWKMFVIFQNKLENSAKTLGLTAKTVRDVKALGVSLEQYKAK